MNAREECEKYLELLNRFIDGETSEEEKDGLKAHLSKCGKCQMELEKYKKLKELTGSLKFVSPPEELWEEYPKDVLARLERGLGKTILCASLLLIIIYAAVKLARSASVPLIVKIALIGLASGFLMLLFSVYRQRRKEEKTDKYKEIKR